jgi:hypothetical protein
MEKYKLSSDKNRVILGDKSFTEYFNPPKYPYHFWDWAYSAGYDFEDKFDPHPKAINAHLCKTFGPKIPLRFSAAMYNTFIKDNVPLEAYFAVKRLGYHWKMFDTRLVNVAATKNHLVQQAVRDNTLNVLPLMLRAEKDTQELKAHFGKGLWKKLANTSKTRMTYLAPLVLRNPEWADIRSCILKEAWTFEGGERYTVFAARLAPKAGTFQHTFNLVTDTIKMGDRLKEPVNLKWSYKRLEEEHNRMSRAILLGKFSAKAFTEVVTYHEEEGYTFTLLNSQLDIAQEGKVMGHCVGSYARTAAQGQYAVFKVEGNSERATLGLQNGAFGFTFNQCYGKYNSKVSDNLLEAAKKIVKRYNDHIRL